MREYKYLVLPLGLSTLMCGVVLSFYFDRKTKEANHLQVVYSSDTECQEQECYEVNTLWEKAVLGYYLENGQRKCIWQESNVGMTPVGMINVEKKYGVKNVPALAIIKGLEKQTVIAGPVMPFMCGKKIFDPNSGCENDKKRVWNICEMEHFVKFKVVPPAMNCEKMVIVIPFGNKTQ